MNDLEKKFKKTLKGELAKELGLKNVMAAPDLTKATVGMGLSKAAKNQEIKQEMIKILTAITGQKPIVTRAKKAISGFKIREGQEVGLAVTLRGRRMWDFTHKLINASLPRIKDFQGFPLKSIDGQGNITIGIKEQLVFPEILPESANSILGLQITLTTGAKNKSEGIALLKKIGFPLAHPDK